MKDNQKGADLSTAKTVLSLIIVNEKFEWRKQYISGREVKGLVNPGDDVDLFLSIVKPWEDELIGDDDVVDLARPGIERFYFKNFLWLTINDKKFKWYDQYISGQELKKLGNISPDDDLFLSIQKPWNDEVIDNNTKVDLARPGIEHFFSKEKPTEIKIIVNGREKSWLKNTITFDEVVGLAEGNTDNTCKAYTVTYLKGPKQNPQGEMGKGDFVYVTNKMIFNATATDKS